MLTYKTNRTRRSIGCYFNIILVMVSLLVSELSYAAIGFVDGRTMATVDRTGKIEEKGAPLDYIPKINVPANYNEIYVSDVYLDHFDGKSIATLVFKAQKTQNEIIRGVGAYIKASPRMALPDYIAREASFEGYVYSIEKTIPNIYLIRFPIRRVQDSFEYDLRIDALAYFVDIEETSNGRTFIKRLWVNNNGKNFTHEDIFNGSLEHWNRNITSYGATRETYTIRPNSTIFDAARKYYNCGGLFSE